MKRLRQLISAATFAWLAVYIPLETYVTLDIAGPRGLLYASYVLNVVGMATMLWGAVTTWRRRPAGSAVLAVGWSWTAATFWRATSDRYWWAANGNTLYAGPAELWVAPLLTALAVACLVASLVLVFREAAAFDGL